MPDTRKNGKNRKKPIAPGIRPLLPEDYCDVGLLDWEAFDAGFAWSATTLKTVLLAEGVQADVATVCGRIAGYCVWSEGCGEVRLLRLAVAPMFQRRGIGRALLSRATSGERAWHLATAIVPEDDSRTHLFLADAGFRWVSTEPAAAGGEDCVFVLAGPDDSPV